MNDLISPIADAVRDTVFAVGPIAGVVVIFQLAVLRRPLPHLRRMLVGVGLVMAGVALFLAGLSEALFPLGKVMAEQLVTQEMEGVAAAQQIDWRDFTLVYVFGAAIGFATTIAEPALIAVSMKAEDISGGTLSAWGLRIVVAIGVAIGIAVGCLRIVTGAPLPYFIITGYVFVAIQAMRAPRSIIALAFDTGGVTTSTVTVPLVAALGLGLASSIPGRSPLIDGFGLIAFASLFPMITVMGYAQIGEYRRRRRAQPARREV